MPFLENLILGKPGSDRRRRYAQDSSLTGDGEDDTGLENYGAFSLLRSLQRAGADLVGSGPTGDDQKICGSLLCNNVWTVPWRSREHSIFEGQWACSSRCLSAMVRAALARQAGDDGGDEPEPHHHRIPLGLVLLAQGWITHPQLQKALEAQRRHGSGRIGEWLVAECGMRPERIARGLGVQWNCPVLSTESFWPEAMAPALPRVFLEEYGVVPLRLAGRKILYIGFRDSLDASISFALEQMTGLRTESGLLPEAEFSEAREILLRCEFPQHTMSAVSDRDGLARAIVETIEHAQPEASRLVRLHRYYWLRVWAKGQSDRTAGGLAQDVSSVNDYLFTIGSRPPRSIQRESTNQEPRAGATAERANHEAGELPILPIVAEAAGVTPAEDTPAENVAPAANGGQTVRVYGEKSEVRSAAIGEDAIEVEFAGAQLVLGKAAGDHLLTKVDSSQASSSEMDANDFDKVQQIASLGKTGISLQESALLVPIEGEYLPVSERLTASLAIVGSSALEPANQPSRLRRVGRLLRLKPSFPNQQSDPASDQDPGV